jgi:hypothetical protein
MALAYTTTPACTIAFATTSWSAGVTSMSISGGTRNALDTSHILLSEYQTQTAAGEPRTDSVSASRTFIPSGYYDPGQLEITFRWQNDNQPPVTSPAETVTITFSGTGGEGGRTACWRLVRSLFPGRMLTCRKTTRRWAPSR